MIIGKSLTALGGGGPKPEIHVTAKAGALLNLHYKGSSIILQSYQLGESETQHTFVVRVSETAYVAEDVTNGASVEVLVDVVAVFDVQIEYPVYILKPKTDCTDVTGGWTYTSSTWGWTTDSDGITTMTRNGNYNTPPTTNNTIDFSKFSKITVKWRANAYTTNSIPDRNFTCWAGDTLLIRFWHLSDSEIGTMFEDSEDISSVTDSSTLSFSISGVSSASIEYAYLS